MKNILVTGSLAFDFIMDFPQTFEENIIPEKIHQLSVSFLAQNFSRNFGGVAGNIAYNLTLLNQNSAILASSGKKDFNPYEKHLNKAGVNVTLIKQVDNEFSANMFMITDKNNCQIAGFYPGATNSDETLVIDQELGNFSLIVIAPTVPNAMDNFVKQAKKLDLPYLYDPAQQIPRLSKEQLKNGLNGAEIIIGNDYELALITKKTGISKEQMLKTAKVVITTLGEKGSLVETKTDKFIIGIAKPKIVVDPTGAGDSYIAGFLTGYLNNQPLKTAGQMGAVLATYAIEKYGTQNHKFTIEEFKKRYQDNFGEKLEL